MSEELTKAANLIMDIASHVEEKFADHYLLGAVKLARHYLSPPAPGPGFDAEWDLPVTEEWLRSVGFEDNVLRDALEVGPARLWHFKEQVLGIDHPNGFFQLPTRGSVRHFCIALGIPLPPAPNERNGE